ASLKQQLPEIDDIIRYVQPIILDDVAVKLGPWSGYNVLAHYRHKKGVERRSQNWSQCGIMGHLVQETVSMPQRFRKTFKESFFGDFIYSMAIPEDHFLAQLDKVINWEQFTPLLIEAYKGKAERGEVPYQPTMILKMLLLSYLYDISERRAEDLCNYYLPGKQLTSISRYGIFRAANAPWAVFLLARW
ncbi:MAG: transposase, partial [Chloroflexota bacterium]